MFFNIQYISCFESKRLEMPNNTEQDGSSSNLARGGYAKDVSVKTFFVFAHNVLY